MAYVLGLACLIFTTFSVTIASHDGVPALFWTNTITDFPIPIAGHTTESDEFRTDYLQRSVVKAGHTLVAFVQDKLSLEDIIDNADVYNEHSNGAKFKNLKLLVETHTNVHLPSVSYPGEALDRMVAKFKGSVHHMKHPYTLDHVTIDATAPNLVIVQLPHNDGKSFDAVDGIIGSITKDLESLKVAYTAVYTGKSPSQVPEVASYSGRHLLTTDTKQQGNYSVYNFTSCIIAFKEMRFELNGIANKDDKKPTPTNYNFNLTKVKDTDGTSCDNATGIIVLTFDTKEHSDLVSFKVLIHLGYDKFRFWNASIKISYKILGKELANDNTTLDSEAIVYAPKAFSYHCYKPYFFVQKNVSNDEYVAQLGIQGFQIQFGLIKNNKFGRPNDCESFFTVPVLSGLLVGLILLSILMFGICMILNINTMDRFDDPKGKTITVNTAEG